MTSVIEKLPVGYDEYLKVSLDPYHDSSIRFEGAPTSRNAATVTLCLNQEETYSAADFGIITPQWDAHFVMYPFIKAIPLLSGNEKDFTTSLLDFALGTPVMYPMSVHGVPSGTETYMTADYQLNLPPQIQGLDCGALASYATGNNTGTSSNGPGRRMLRIVGESFEVVDESPDLYQQGACTVYRYPIDVTPANRVVRHSYESNTTNALNPFGPNSVAWGGGVLSRSVNCYDIRAPPSNTSVAVLINGSKTWKAKEGAYVVGTQYTSEVPFKTLDNSDVLFTGYTPTAGNSTLGADARYSFGSTTFKQSYQGGSHMSNPDYDPLISTNAFFPFNMSGAYFTGLSTQYATLRLRYRVYVEILADPGDNTLAPLASPSLPYEQLLQEFCMKVIAQEEAGVPQTMNPKGEKWKKVLRSISKVANAAGPVLDLVMPGLGGATAATGTALDSVTRVKAASKKKKAKPAKGKQ